MRLVLSAVLSYAIGSISPAFILGKIVGKVDVRTRGDGNAGTLNTFALLGIVPGLITGLFDISKGILSLLLCHLFFGLEGNLLLIPICTAISGHIFPFYMRFRGGQGSATAIGLLLFFLVPMVVTGRLPVDGLLILLAVIALMTVISTNAESIGAVVLPLLLFYITANAGRGFPYLVTVLLAGFLCGTTLFNFIKKKVYRRSLPAEANPRKIVSWTYAALLILLYALFGRTLVTVAVASASFVSLGLDLYGLYSRDRDRSAFITLLLQRHEMDGFSSVTFLLFSALSVVLIFPRDVTLLILSFLVGGAVFGDVFGSSAAGNEPLGRVNLKNCLSYLAGALVAGYVASALLELEMLLIVVGAAATAVAALLSGDRDASAWIVVLSAAAISVLRHPM